MVTFLQAFYLVALAAKVESPFFYPNELVTKVNASNLPEIAAKF